MKRRDFFCIVGGAVVAAYTAGLLAEEYKLKGPLCIDGELLEISKEGLQVPYSIGNVIDKHVNSIFHAGFAYKMAHEDFDHGHFLIPRKGVCSPQFPYTPQEDIECTLPEYFRSIEGFLYHTRERLEDWIPGHDNPPRSIIGFHDGSISIPALDSKLYNLHGTINGHEPFIVLGMQNPYNDPHVNALIKGRKYFMLSQFFLKPSETGAYATRETKYNIWLPIFHEVA